MENRAPGSSSLLGSLRALADALLGSVHDRFELWTVELEEEKHRLIRQLIWIGALVVLGLLALVFVSIALLVAFWDTARVLVATLLAAAYAGGFVAAAIAFRRARARQPRPFAGTLQELEQDRSWMRTSD